MNTEKIEPKSYKEKKEENNEYNRKAVLKYNQKYEKTNILSSTQE